MDEKRIRVAFICIENARRSQMAEAFAELFGKDKLEVYSAGSRPAPAIDPLVIEVMREKRIDLSSKHIKSLGELPPLEMDYLITMGCEETCPSVLSKKVLEWNIPDPKGKSIDAFKHVRDLIEEKVKALVESLT